MSTYLRIPLASEPASVRRAREAVRSWLVDRLASRWESEAHERGKITWAEITQEPAGSPAAFPDDDGHGRPTRWHLGWRGEGSRRATTSDR